MHWSFRVLVQLGGVFMGQFKVGTWTGTACDER